MLILASQSPRRREILQGAGIPFSVRPAPPIDESVRPGELPDSYVKRLAREKAEAAELRPGECILGADTTVCAGGEILGKPGSVAEALRMIELLSGRTHEVLTGVCLRDETGCQVEVERTRVTFAPLGAAEMAEYAASGEPTDKAGGYGIQGLASKFVDRIEGCYFNVMGLPVALVYRMLRERAAARRQATRL